METPTSHPQQIGNYDLLAKIAEGGMGAVFKGRSHLTGQIVAIKIVPPETAKNPVLLKRFKQEFEAANRFDHPNIVKAIEYDDKGPSPFLVMEYVDGESLGQRVERVGPLPEDEAVRLIAQVCDGLHRAHKQGLIHRDVKPDNILVTSGGVAKLTDMGLVKDVEGELNLTRTGRGLGTPHFMAPEQFRNAKNVDVRGDIYSLGATLYMLVTGHVPFARTSPLDCWMRKVNNDFPAPRALNPRLSERTDWAIRRAMSADQSRRPASCREFVEDLMGQTWRGRADEAGATPDLWYLVYKDADGQQKTVKGTTDSIRQNLKVGSLGDPTGVLVSRTKTGAFTPLRSVAEFRDLVIEPAKVAPGGVGKPTPAAVPGTPRTRSPADPKDVPTVTGGRTSPVSAAAARRQPAPDPQAEAPTDPQTVLLPAPVGKGRAKPAAAGGLPAWVPVAVMIAVAVLAGVIGALVFLR